MFNSNSSLYSFVSHDSHKAKMDHTQFPLIYTLNFKSPTKSNVFKHCGLDEVNMPISLQCILNK
jgi:hypothetical protein